AISASTITGIAINGVDIGEVKVEDNDKTGALVDAINAVKDQTGIEASIDSRGRLNLVSNDGRGISAKGLTGTAGLDAKGANNFGRLSLTKLDGRDIKVSASTGAGFSATSTVAQATVNLRDVKGTIDANIASAMGFNSNSNVENITSNKSAGVTTLKGAQAMISIAESAQKALDRIRSDLGSVQNQLTSTVDNISVTQVNVAAAESNIRDVDFAAESATFNKHNLLAQSGSYAMSQANSVQQNVMRLLQ
ncbi:MAG: flagellin, partial [Campylobacterales bacterium]